VPFFGTGGLGERIWTGPAITVTGMDVLPVDRAVNAVVPYARAKVSLRVHPEQDPEEAQAALARHLEGLRPFGIDLTVHTAETGQGFAAKTSGPAYEAARAALAHAWGAETVSFASGGSIPLVSALQEAVPDAEMLLMGTTDGFANIHAPNERVLLDEFEKATVAEAEFFGRYAEATA
jgi:cysteinylglycine-S-conjugate dipeptidase